MRWPRSSLPPNPPRFLTGGGRDQSQHAAVALPASTCNASHQPPRPTALQTQKCPSLPQ